VIVTVIAFVINIGLFVKAKINLQNATDAAAFSGASVQARQLTKIAYLNWEMRNIYKEWLYKYYVIGNLNIEDVRDSKSSKSDVMQFKLLPETDPLNNNNIVQEDLFNIPAVCIHIDRTTNICRRYSIFGFPEFQSSGVSGAEEASRVFMDTLISQKINDCNERSKLNMMVANNWTYNVLGESWGKSLGPQAPPILADRQGAWPKAVELALRIRNLEYVMNTKANSDGINIGNIDEIQNEKKLGNERIVKAFYSAYRNLGNEVDNEMKMSFTLTELSPKKYSEQNEYSASNLLIPNAKKYDKQWVDLKLMMVNYAIFFAAMVPTANKKKSEIIEGYSAACDISKVAIPVPGYPLGFYKNPDVVTYYAVKGEADFEGMFNPFSKEKITLTAYAAAKPMGGRIGPMLFTQRSGENYIRGRTDPFKYRSVPYLTSYQFEGVTIKGDTYSENSNGGPNIKKFIPGLPIPTNSNDPKLGKFWLEDPYKPVGGKLSEPKDIQFGVPNLVYDYQQDFRSTGYTEASQMVHIINAKVPNSEKPVGLFSKIQFDKFKGSLDPTEPITDEDLKAEIARIRAPTLYEAANYLIPTHHEFNKNKNLDSFGFITSHLVDRKKEVEIYQSQVYAPLYGSNQKDLLFNNQNEVTKTIFDFMKLQEPGMEKYLMAMNKVAKNIFDTKPPTPNSDSKQSYEKAAGSISDIKNFNDSNYLNSPPESCKSLAGQFLYFYFGETIESSLLPKDPKDCPVPLGKLLQEYYSSATTDPNYDPDYYAFDYSVNNPQLIQYMTAYRPGPYTGADLNGEYINPLNPSIRSNMQRNFYSTKFISLNSVRREGGEDYGNKGFHIFSEGEVISSGQALDTLPNGFMNVLETNDQGLNSIEH
jgi:hypothetical protein